MDCELCGKIISIYGWTAKDILEVQRWLQNQNMTLDILKCSSAQPHYLEKQKIADFIMEP